MALFQVLRSWCAQSPDTFLFAVLLVLWPLTLSLSASLGCSETSPGAHVDADTNSAGAGQAPAKGASEDTELDSALGGDVSEGDGLRGPSQSDSIEHGEGDSLGTSSDGDGPDGAEPDAGALPRKPIPPVVLGPDYATYDCRWSEAQMPLPGRLSPVPLDCPLDPDCRLPMVIGHRGAGGDFGAMAPENSLAAVRAAILAGFDGVELDVQPTSDGHLVLMHDSTVDRTTFGTGKVSAFTLEEISQLQLRPPPFAVGGEFECERVPTFDEALELAKGRLFVDVDIKTSRVDLVVEAITRTEMFDYAYVSTRELDRALQARELDSRIRVQVRADTPDKVFAFTNAIRPSPDIYEIAPSIAEQVRDHVHGLGRSMFTNSWGMDALYYFDENPSHYLQVYGQGVDILQSEYPIQVLQVLGRWPQ